MKDVRQPQIETLKEDKDTLGRTHLMSPIMAAYTAINGTIGDPYEI